jgi:hypothetical protein
MGREAVGLILELVGRSSMGGHHVELQPPRMLAEQSSDTLQLMVPVFQTSWR